MSAHLVAIPADMAPDMARVRAAWARSRHVVIVASPGVLTTMMARRLADEAPGPQGFADRWVAAVIQVWAFGAPRSCHPRHLDGRHEGSPFRAPHHTCSARAMLGGGRPLRPGEVTLAHGGVLLLDEIAEFSRAAIEGLHEPLNTGSVVFHRVGPSWSDPSARRPSGRAPWRTHAATLPASFRVVAVTQPCPCGYLGHAERACMCSPAVVDRYRSRWASLAARPDFAGVDLTTPANQEDCSS